MRLTVLFSGSNADKILPLRYRPIGLYNSPLLCEYMCVDAFNPLVCCTVSRLLCINAFNPLIVNIER